MGHWTPQVRVTHLNHFQSFGTRTRDFFHHFFHYRASLFALMSLMSSNGQFDSFPSFSVVCSLYLLSLDFLILSCGCTLSTQCLGGGKQGVKLRSRGGGGQGGHFLLCFFPSYSVPIEASSCRETLSFHMKCSSTYTYIDTVHAGMKLLLLVFVM